MIFFAQPASTCADHVLEHFAFRWNHLKVSKMLQSQKHRASFAGKTAHTFAHDALGGSNAVAAPLLHSATDMIACERRPVTINFQRGGDRVEAGPQGIEGFDEGFGIRPDAGEFFERARTSRLAAGDGGNEITKPQRPRFLASFLGRAPHQGVAEASGAPEGRGASFEMPRASG
jgi:hypothetical protein